MMESFDTQKEDPDKGNVLLLPVLFLKSLFLYFVFKLRQWTVYGYAWLTALVIWLTNLKSWSVRKMFWGRSSFYKSAIHIFVGTFTLIITISGISSRLNVFQEESQGLVLASGVVGSNDMFLQEGTAESIVPVDPNQLDYEIYKHTVEKGETFASIAETYTISVDTIKWANNVAPWNDSLSVGQVLDIPPMDGVLYTVRKGDTVQKIANLTKGNEIDIVELNGLDFENPVIAEGQRLFVPDGRLEAPKPIPTKAPPGPTYTGPKPPDFTVPAGSFIRPLPGDCGKWSRGFTSYHGGVDIAQPGGCWIRAAGGGRVVVAGFRNAGQGFMVEIDHGTINGQNIRTRYYHGNGSYRVKEGDQVVGGQDIMHMGCTGRCYGTHLHFEFVVNGGKANPEKHVPGLR